MLDVPPNVRTAQTRRTRVTSFDVAAEAGVSQSTVSRALAGDPVVSETTRARVFEAARKLDYHIDENAARLRTGRTGTLAVAVIVRPGDLVQDQNPFYYALLGAICAAASRRGYETLVSFQSGSAQGSSGSGSGSGSGLGNSGRLFGHYQEQRKADGLIVLGASDNREAWDYFHDLGAGGAHVVCWGSPHDDLAWIRSDNLGGARLATRHLLDSGYRRIACLTSLSPRKPEFNERYEGYVATLAEAGLAPLLVEVEPGLTRNHQGRRAIATLLESGQPVDAIFAACDEMALGALHELQDRGVAVPAMVGVIGFDGIYAGAHASPPLSTIEPDFETAGALLVDRLLGLVTGRGGEERRVPVRLLARGSTAK